MTTSPEPYHEDPDAPYFEHLFGVLKGERPDITREEALAIIRKIDPTDQLRISRPQAELQAEEESTRADGDWYLC